MELSGNKAKLRLMTSNDVVELYNIVQKNPTLWTYMVRRMNSFEDMQTLVAEALTNLEKKTELPFVVIDQDSNSIIGSTRLYDISYERLTVELGSTFYDKSAQKTSINTECKYLLLKLAFEDLHMIRVQIKTDVKNIQAQKALERIGAIKEGVLRNERILHNGRIRDAVVYSITNNDWTLVKGKLEKLLARSYNKTH
ncbi:GNAT family protein [Priestia aryabhattai]|uniref:GNAT family protein n=1 Tax=Priestia aryabhattai TaxID=412384 RepID=A0AAX6NE28_PRIAR|nr:GNAT family protein [Priestia aryabhattai]MDU9694037.1 GNAT family protein [Priestia aryabhattai]NGY88658.1 GNAT family N-acetyltransferase [Priestia megaterium]